MPLFRYKAATLAGEVLEGEMDAADEQAVIRRLQSEGHIPIRAEQVRAGGAPAAREGWLRLELLRGRGLSTRDVAVLTLELATLLQAGLSLDRSLEILSDLAAGEPTGELLAEVHASVRGGASLSDALGARGDVFSPFYLNMVRAGEAAGALDMALARLAEFMQRSREIREAVTSAMIYPVILVFIAILSLVVVLGLVVPRFAVMFEDAGQELPLPTRIVVAAGEFLGGYWWALALVGVAAWLYFRRALRVPETRLRLHARLLRAPVLGELIGKLEVARFARTLGTLLGNGVPLLNGLAIAREIVANQAVAAAVAKLPSSVREGKGLAKPLLQAGVFPPLAGRMLQVGEETGNLESMLMRLAEVYEREIQTALRRVLALVEPALILGLGLLIAGIIMSIVVAILRVNTLAF